MSLIENGKYNKVLQDSIIKNKDVKLRKNTAYLAGEDYKLVPTKISNIIYEDRHVHEIFTSEANYKILLANLVSRIKSIETKHGCGLENIKTKESHIPLVLEKNHAGYIKKAYINRDIVYLYDKSQIPVRINQGCYKEVNGEFIEDKNKTLMSKEVL